jgi:hypothetical protein
VPTNPYDLTSASDLGAKPTSARSLVILALVSLHVSAVLYLLVGLVMPILLSDDGAGGDGMGPTEITLVAAFCVLLAGGVEVVAWGIHKRRFWAWIAGLIVFGTYTASLFFPLGVLGLWGLLASRSRIEFGVARNDGCPTAPAR